MFAHNVNELHPMLVDCLHWTCSGSLANIVEEYVLLSPSSLASRKKVQLLDKVADVSVLFYDSAWGDVAENCGGSAVAAVCVCSVLEQGCSHARCCGRQVRGEAVQKIVVYPQLQLVARRSMSLLCRSTWWWLGFGQGYKRAVVSTKTLL